MSDGTSRQSADLLDHQLCLDGLLDAPEPVTVEVATRVVFNDSDRTIREWTITAGRYRAIVPECACGLARTLGTSTDPVTGKVTATTVPVRNCLCRSDACRDSGFKRHLCHGWHQPRVDRLAADIAKTAKKGTRR